MNHVAAWGVSFSAVRRAGNVFVLTALAILHSEGVPKAVSQKNEIQGICFPWHLLY